MPFKKGQSGNPMGGPRKDNTFANLFERIMHKRKTIAELQEMLNDPESKLTVKERIVIVNIIGATAGDLKTTQFIAERCDGKPFQQIDHTTNGNSIAPKNDRYTDEQMAAMAAALDNAGGLDVDEIPK